MTPTPLLSIVIPTRGTFSASWLERLLQLQGNIEFILVYPPGISYPSVTDPRVRWLTSPYKGEVIQRSIGLLNATAPYIIALDDDDFLHPEVLKCIQDYFAIYPDSWVLRLSKRCIDAQDLERINSPWNSIPQLSQLPVKSRRDSAHEPCLQRLPIAPLKNRFQWKALVPTTHRTDHHGPHLENFNNYVWKTAIVQPALVQLLSKMHLGGPLVWLPLWSLDRLLGLFIQAMYFQSHTNHEEIGHWLNGPEQSRYIERPPATKEIRCMWPGDMLLALKFPKYGYFWNLFFDEFWNMLKTIARFGWWSTNLK